MRRGSSGLAVAPVVAQARVPGLRHGEGEAETAATARFLGFRGVARAAPGAHAPDASADVSPETVLEVATPNESAKSESVAQPTKSRPSRHNRSAL